MAIKHTPYFVEIFNKFTKQFTKELLVDAESYDNAIQKTIPFFIFYNDS